VFENRVAMRTCGEEVTGSWRNLHNQELYDRFDFSSSIVRMTISRRMKMGRACGIRGRDQKFLHSLGYIINLHGRHNLEDPGVDGRIILKQIMEGVFWMLLV
jgi:hypothetical protein